MFISRAFLFTAALVAQSASAQPTTTQPDRAAPPPAERNANAPDAPALEQEPHGSGSVYEELDALRKDDKSKEQTK
jgi:hypothetical protein